MSWGLGRHPTVRIGVTQSLSQAYQVTGVLAGLGHAYPKQLIMAACLQVWCPHVAQGPCLGSKQAQATSLAAPTYASGGRAELPFMP